MGLAVKNPTSLRGADEQAALAALSPDAIVVAAYGLMLPQAVLDVPRLGCVNIHASLLPRWRGAAPIQRAILAGDSETGISIMRMESGLDTGPVLARRSTPIWPTDDCRSLHDRLAAMGADMVVDALDDLAAGKALAFPQPAEGATYAAKITREDENIIWTDAAEQIDRRIRALSPWPLAGFASGGDDRIKVLKAEIADGKTDSPAGSLLDDVFSVACGDGRAIRILRAQRAGRAATDAPSLLRGLRLPVGHRFP